MSKTNNKKWYDYMYVFSALYLFLGLFNILFAWLGLICFITPLMISIIKGDKSYCNKYCGRGQIFELLGKKFSLNLTPPTFLRKKWFRYAFLTFFMTMFILMLYGTFQVFKGRELQEIITLLWVFKLPWNWVDVSGVSPWFAQFCFGFYSVMLTSTILGIITMILFRPRTWCVYCPMGTMTQAICQIKK